MSTIPNNVIGTCRDILDKFEALNLDRHVPELRTFTERAEELRDRHTNAPAQFRAEKDRLVTALAAGEITADQAVDGIVRAAYESDRDGTAVQTIREAAQRAGAVAWEYLNTRGDDLIHDVFAPEGERILKTITAEGAKVPEHVDSAGQALAEGPKVAAAWHAMNGAGERWFDVYDLIGTLRRAGILTRARQGVSLMYRNGEAIDRDQTRGLSPARKILAAIEAGAEPVFLTGAEANAELLAKEEREELARRAQGDRRGSKYAGASMPRPEVMAEIAERFGESA